MTQQQSKEAQYTECFVAFIDLLGFKDLVKKSETDPAMIATLAKALNRIALDTPQSTHAKVQRDQAGQPVGYKTCVLQVRPFSDCVCLFVPTAAERLPWLLRSVRYIHDRMLELGICIRGAITIGWMYWDDTWGATPPALHEKLCNQQFNGQSPSQTNSQNNQSDVLYQADAGGFPITFGPALVEAYTLEQEKARYPRVIASANLVQYLRKNGSAPAFPLTAPSSADSGIPVSEFFRRDSDDVRFLDLLHEKIERKDTERITQEVNADGTKTWRWEHRTTSWSDVVRLAKELADSKLEELERVHEKYVWLKSYAAESAGNQSKAEDG